MRLDHAGVPFIVGALVPAAVALLARQPVIAVPFAALSIFFAFFFRDPARQVPQGRNLVLAPADGRVLVAGPALAEDRPDGDWTQISIFLSPMDVHVNRSPVAGEVTHVAYQPGRFLPAYDARAASENERNEIWIDHDGEAVVCRQVVGLLARRVVCRVSPGRQLTAGDRIGIMKFGSRMDVFVPTRARLEVRVGDRVQGGETILAELGE